MTLFSRFLLKGIFFLIPLSFVFLYCEQAQGDPGNSTGRSLADKKASVLRGNELAAVSQVAYYYDSLRRCIERKAVEDWKGEELDEIMYVPSWGQWICNEPDYRGHKVEITDTVSDGDDEARENEYEDYLSKSEDGVIMDSMYFTIATNQPVMERHLFTMTARLFFTSQRNPVLGIFTSWSEGDEPYRSACSFYLLRKGKWSGIHPGFPGADDFSLFFSDSVDIGLIQKYGAMGVEADLRHDGDTVYVKPYLTGVVDCYTMELNSPYTPGADTTGLKKLCDYASLLNSNGFAYVFDPEKIAFRRADPVTSKIHGR